MSSYFTLDSGREVSIETVHIHYTYENILEGDPDFSSQIIWRSMPNRLERDFGQGVVILKPAERRLPDYTFVAVLHSLPLPSDPPEHYSYVTICWFQEGLSGNLVEFVQHAAKGLEWERHAKNWTI